VLKRLPSTRWNSGSFVGSDLVMNTPSSKPKQRYSWAPLAPKSPSGSYTSGITVPQFAQVLGEIVAYWSEIEEAMILVLAILLGNANIHQSPARQVFRSLTSEQVRLKVMRSLLHEAPINQDKDEIFDEIIDEFEALNKLRNNYVHGLWATHRSGRVFIAEATTDNDVPFLRQKPISIKQLENTLKRMRDLITKIYWEVCAPATLPKRPP
jgi:hypothetical protein